MSIESSKGVWKSGPGRGRVRPKGRQLDDLAWSQVQDLLGQRPRRRDLLIEFLHLIQDAYGHLSAAHLRALAEEMRDGDVILCMGAGSISQIANTLSDMFHLAL